MSALQVLAGFFPPDLSLAYLAALVGPALESAALALGAVTVGALVALPLAAWIALAMPGARLLGAGLSVLRAVPDLTLAILAVILLGIGTGAALAALTIYYTASMARVFADLMANAPRRPLEALAATGASRRQIALWGLIPTTSADLIAYGGFATECALRAAVIVGAVGGGGLGAELAGSLAVYDLPRVATATLVLVAIVALFDQAVALVQRRPRFLWLVLATGLVCAVALAPHTMALSHAAQVMGAMFPPHLDAAQFTALPFLVAQTVAIAAIGTLGAALLAAPAALAASRRLAPTWLYWPVRLLLDLIRTVPEVVSALVLVAMIGLGPAAGAIALGIHSFGSLGRLFADAIDAAPEAPQQALRVTGAGPIAIALFATVPLSAATLATHLVFRFEWNLRMATVLGLIGAGGIGQALYQAQQLFFYDQALAYVAVTAALILAAEALCNRVRRKLRLDAGRRFAQSRVYVPRVRACA